MRLYRQEGNVKGVNYYGPATGPVDASLRTEKQKTKPKISCNMSSMASTSEVTQLVAPW
jgi:hypothetical protein